MAAPLWPVNNADGGLLLAESTLEQGAVFPYESRPTQMMIERETRLLPPGPEEQCDIDANEESFHKIWELFERFGDIYKIDAPGRDRPTYVLNHPDLVQHVLADNHRNYIKGMGFERVRMLLGNGLIVSEGAFWRKQRRMIQPAFNKENIACLSEIMRRCSLQVCEKWEQKADRGEAINITNDLSEMALEVILRTTFGDDFNVLCRNHGGNPFAILTEHTRDLQLVLKVRALAPLIMGVVEDRRRADRHEVDFLSMYMDARDRSNGQPMTDKDLLDEVVTLVVAGHETTAATLNWVWYVLSQNPEAEAALHEEVDQLELDGAPRYDDLPRLSYAKQVMAEALRLYPPVWLFTRRAVGEDWLGDYYVAPGTDIMLSPYVVHRHPKFWPGAEDFRPERFSEEGAKGRHKFAYFPFSMGPRGCAGEFFAFAEVQIHLGLLASRLRLRYLPEQKPELEPAFNLRSKHGLMMMAQRR